MMKLLKNLKGFFLLVFAGIILFNYISVHNFDENVFDKNNIKINSEKISSLKNKKEQALYIENYFKNIGIMPAGDNDTFFQNYNIIGDSGNLEEVSNILGKIDGKNKSEGCLIISGRIDEDACEAAVILELARDMMLQKYRPSKTVIFAFWNSYGRGMEGSKYYTEYPAFPLDESNVIVIDNIDKNIIKNVFMLSYGQAGKALMEQLSAYSEDNETGTITNENIHGNDIEAFLYKDVPAVLIQGDSNDWFYGMRKGNKKKYGTDAAGSLLLSFIHRNIYKDFIHGLLTGIEKVFLIIIISAMFFICFIKRLFKMKPSADIFKIKIKSIYYSSVFMTIDKFIKLLVTILILLFLILFFINIPVSFDIVKYEGHYIPNYPIYLIIKNAHSSMINFVEKGFGKTISGFSVWPLVSHYTVKSMILIICSLILSFITGTFGGIISGFKIKKKNGMIFFGSIALLSMPDVLVAVLLQLILGILYKSFPEVIGRESVNQFIFPLISLSFIPAAYITRITQVAVREEINKDYIVAARAKGLSDFYILKNHILVSVVIKVVESLPSILNIIISNLIIVEYFFAYLGIVYQFFHYFDDGDINACMGMIIGIAAMYFILYIIFRLTAVIVNPYKRKNITGGTAHE